MHKFINDRICNSMRSIVFPLFFYIATTNVIVIGYYVAPLLFPPSANRGWTFGYSFEAYTNWDGQWYTKIAAEGYSYDESKQSSVAFFPLYPVLGYILSRITQLDYDICLLIISNASLFASMIIISEYIKAREVIFVCPNHIIVLLLLEPFSFFLRICYSESLFLLLTALALFGIQRHWRFPLISGIVGLATATRPVGIGLIMPLFLHIWINDRSVRRFTLRILGLLPIACFGITGYIIFQWYRFGEPLAFIKTKIHWKTHGSCTFSEKLVDLITLEPVWRMLDPSSRGYWSFAMANPNPIFCPHLADPIFFLLICVLTIIGWYRKYLNTIEITLSFNLLLIPYCTNGFDTYMFGMGRYSSIVFPAYFVLARLLLGTSKIILGFFAVSSALLLCIFSGLFFLWYTIV